MCKETEKFQNEIADVLFDGKQLLATEAERRLEKMQLQSDFIFKH